MSGGTQLKRVAREQEVAPPEHLMARQKSLRPDTRQQTARL